MRAETIHVKRMIPTQRRRLRVGLTVLLLLAGVLLGAEGDDGQDPALDAVGRFLPSSYSSGWLTSDRNADGVIDYAVKIDEKGNKLREAMDFNYDGRMDNFYFYANDVLQWQEVDSNYNRQVDIWIYLWRGVYVRKWERDIDHDGVVDISRDYDERRE